MTAKANVKIKFSNVKKILDAMAGDNLGRAVVAGGLVFEGKAKLLAPIDTGNLANSIETVLFSSNATSAEAHVWTGVEYAPAQEFGTSKIRPHPFMRPAWDANIERIKSAIAKWAQSSIYGAADDNG